MTAFPGWYSPVQVPWAIVLIRLLAKLHRNSQSKTHWTLKTSGSKLSLFPVSTNGSAEWNEEIQASFQPEWWQKVIHAYWPGERAVIYFFRFKRNPNPQNSLHRQVSCTKQLLWQGIGRTTTFVLVVLMQPHKNESQLSWLRTGRKRTWRELD